MEKGQVTLLVNGINCGGCAKSLTEAFAAAEIQVVSITTKKESGEHPNAVVVVATLEAAKEAVAVADKGRGKFTIEEAKAAEEAHNHGHEAAHEHGHGGGGCCGNDHGHAHDHGHTEEHDHGHVEAHDHSHEGGGGCGGCCAKDDDMPPRMRAAAQKRKAAEEAAANGHAHGHGSE